MCNPASKYVINITTNSVRNLSYRIRVTNTATMRNFDVIFDITQSEFVLVEITQRNGSINCIILRLCIVASSIAV